MLDNLWLVTNFWCAGGSLFHLCVLLLHPRKWLVMLDFCVPLLVSFVLSLLLSLLILSLLILLLLLSILLMDRVIRRPLFTNDVYTLGTEGTLGIGWVLLEVVDSLIVFGCCVASCFVYSIICIKSFVCCFVIIPLNILDVVCYCMHLF